MTLDDAMAALAAKGSDKLIAMHLRNGVPGPVLGVKMGDIRTLAKAAGVDAELARALWSTGVLEARLMAVLLWKPKDLDAEELDRLVRTNMQIPVADWLSSYITKSHKDKEALRVKWLAENNPLTLRAGWSLTAERVVKAPDGLDLGALLDRIAAEMPLAPEIVQWTMNTTLAQIGICHPAFRDRALAMGEAMGVYRDYPTPKGCTSPFAPIWITAMVARNG